MQFNCTLIKKVLSLHHQINTTIMIHLKRQNAAYTTLACVRDAFTRGLAVDLDKFNECLSDGKICCKKCQIIAVKRNKK